MIHFPLILKVKRSFLKAIMGGLNVLETKSGVNILKNALEVIKTIKVEGEYISI